MSFNRPRLAGAMIKANASSAMRTNTEVTDLHPRRFYRVRGLP